MDKVTSKINQLNSLCLWLMRNTRYTFSLIFDTQEDVYLLEVFDLSEKIYYLNIESFSKKSEERLFLDLNKCANYLIGLKDEKEQVRQLQLG